MSRINRTLPPFNALRAFEAAARHLSLSRAAEELNVSRGAVSQQVKLLEEHFNEPLFVRQGSNLALTDQANLYLPLLTETFNNLQAGTQSIFDTKVNHTLTIRIAQSFCHAWLLSRLADFRRKNPKFSIKFYSTVNLYPSTGLDVDIEIINGYGNWQNREVKRLTESEQWVVVASPSFIKQYDFSQSVEAISGYPKIATMGYSEGWQDWFNLHSTGMPFTKPELEFDSTQLSMEAACHGLGMLLAKSILVDDALKAGDLVIVHPNQLKSQSHHHVIINRSRNNQYEVSRFIEWLSESVGETG